MKALNLFTILCIFANLAFAQDACKPNPKKGTCPKQPVDFYKCLQLSFTTKPKPVDPNDHSQGWVFRIADVCREGTQVGATIETELDYVMNTDNNASSLLVNGIVEEINPVTRDCIVAVRIPSNNYIGDEGELTTGPGTIGEKLKNALCTKLKEESEAVRLKIGNLAGLNPYNLCREYNPNTCSLGAKSCTPKSNSKFDSKSCKLCKDKDNCYDGGEVKWVCVKYNITCEEVKPCQETPGWIIEN